MSAEHPDRTPPVLAVDGLSVRYGHATAVRDVNFELPPGHRIALIGANGAGKSSLAGAIAGRLRAATGTIRLDGVDVTHRAAHSRARMGMVLLPEGRGIFPGLDVEENLRLFTCRLPASARAAARERMFTAFPVLAGRRRGQRAGSLSGGEQQMLALARVYATRPRLLVADELSLGLAPRVIDTIFGALDDLRSEGVAMVIVEQYVERVLEFADEAIVLRRGSVAWRGSAANAVSRASDLYLAGDETSTSAAAEPDGPAASADTGLHWSDTTAVPSSRR